MLVLFLYSIDIFKFIWYYIFVERFIQVGGDNMLEINLKGKQFLNALRQVSHGISTDSTHPILKYIYLEVEQKSIVLTSTDGIRLEHASVAALVDSDLVGRSFLIDGHVAKHITSKMLAHGSTFCLQFTRTSDDTFSDKIKLVDGVKNTYTSDPSRGGGRAELFPGFDSIINAAYRPAVAINISANEFRTKQQKVMKYYREKIIPGKEQVEVLTVQANGSISIAVYGDENITQQFLNAKIANSNGMPSKKGELKIFFNARKMQQILRYLPTREPLTIKIDQTTTLAILRKNGFSFLAPIRF